MYTYEMENIEKDFRRRVVEVSIFIAVHIFWKVKKKRGRKSLIIQIEIVSFPN